MDEFFDGYLWKIIKTKKLAYHIAYDIIKRTYNHGFIFFIDNNDKAIHDPYNLMNLLTDEEKSKLLEINKNNERKIHVGERFLFKNIGSSVGVMKDTFIPFDSSF